RCLCAPVYPVRGGRPHAGIDIDVTSMFSVARVRRSGHGRERDVELSIHEVTKVTGVTSRTLRHYDDVGLLTPSRTGTNGYRFYDDDALVRLQRILLLRELGLGLEEIGAVLDRETDEAVALRAHLDWIDAERDRLERQRAAVFRTINSLEGGGGVVAKEMFDGFDHSQYKDEVIE